MLCAICDTWKWKCIQSGKCNVQNAMAQFTKAMLYDLKFKQSRSIASGRGWARYICLNKLGLISCIWNNNVPSLREPLWMYLIRNRNFPFIKIFLHNGGYSISSMSRLIAPSAADLRQWTESALAQPIRRQAIVWTNANVLSIAKWGPFCPG